MIELVTLASAAVTAVSPYFAKMVDGATEKIGESAVETSGKLIGWLRAKLSPAGKEALSDLARDPGDALTQDMLKLQIQKLLLDNPELAGELQSLLPAAAAPTIVQTQTVSGEGAKGAQIAGNSNSVNIG